MKPMPCLGAFGTNGIVKRYNHTVVKVKKTKEGKDETA